MTASAEAGAEEEAERIEQARRVFAGRVEFLKSAPALVHLPPPDEIGRAHV